MKTDLTVIPLDIVPAKYSNQKEESIIFIFYPLCV
jgi:hypothetical protein